MIKGKGEIPQGVWETLNLDTLIDKMMFIIP